MKRLLIIFLFLSIVGTSYAQLQLLQDSRSAGAPLSANLYPEIKGSPYLSDFTTGVVYFSKTDTMKNAQIRFDAFSGMLEINTANGARGFTPDNLIGFDYVQDDILYSFRSIFEIPKKEDGVFVNFLHSGDIAIVENIRASIGDDQNAAYGSVNSKIFRKSSSYFLFHKDKWYALTSNKKNNVALFETLGLYNSQIVKKYKLNFKKVEDVLVYVKSEEFQESQKQ